MHSEQIESRVYPKYKTRYRVINWREYESGLVQQGDVTVWLSPAALDNWKAKPTGRGGGQPEFSDLAIETALTLRLVFHLPLRQLEGFLGSPFRLLGVNLEVPDHTTLSRRSAHLQVSLASRTSNGPTDLIVDSSGFAIVGEGEWAAAKHGGNGRCGRKKPHLGVDACGEIVAEVLTDSNVDDGSIGVAIIEDVGEFVRSVIADAAYDTRPIYDAAISNGAKVVVPPSRKASSIRRELRHLARDRTMRQVKKIGRWRWMKESSYHPPGRVENTFFRFRTTIGGGLCARLRGAQDTEAVLACNALTVLTAAISPHVGACWRQQVELPWARN